VLMRQKSLTDDARMRESTAPSATPIPASPSPPAPAMRRDAAPPPPVAAAKPSAPPPRAELQSQERPAWLTELERQPPEKWLERLAEFKRDGRIADADTLLIEFRRRFPDHPFGAR
jgi:hypothetical protein